VCRLCVRDGSGRDCKGVGKVYAKHVKHCERELAVESGV
jgi:hypothetical protein